MNYNVICEFTFLFYIELMNTLNINYTNHYEIQLSELVTHFEVDISGLLD